MNRTGRFLSIVIMVACAHAGLSAAELHRAAESGDVAKIKHLIAEGKSIVERDSVKRTPLEVARLANKGEAAQFLASLSVKTYPSGSRYVGQLRNRSEHGWGVYFASTGSRYIGHFVDGKFHGLGMWRYADGSKYIGEFRGGMFHEENKAARLPLDVAVQRGSLSAVSLLLELGEDVNAVNKSGQTPLHFAAFEGKKEIALLLIENGAIIDIDDADSQRPLHYASYMGHRELVLLLLERGADIHCKNKYGLTPLHYAVYHDSHDAAQALLDHGASVYKRDNYGMTPIKHAIKLGRARVLKLLQHYRY
jgi:ankyrin repeat protein